MADITLPAQPVFNVPRSFFDKVVLGTLINGEVYFSTEQCCELMEISYKNWSNRMVARTSSEVSRGPVQMDPLYDTYQIPVFTQSTSDTGRGGGTQLINFHHPKKLIEEAMTIRDAEKRKALVHWLINLGNEMIQHGFVIDQHALTHDPLVVPQLQLQLQPAWEDWRFRMAYLNSTLIANVNTSCVDLWLPDGSFDRAKANRTIRQIHGNLYMAQFGKPASMIIHERKDALLLSAGVVSHQNPGYPATHELLNAHNYQHKDEIQARYATTHAILAYVDGMIRTGHIITTETWERASVALSCSDHNPEVILNGRVSRDIYDYRRRIPYRYKDGLSREQVKTDLTAFPADWDRKHFDRANYTAEDCIRFAHYYDVLMYELTDCLDENGNVVINNNAANFPVDGTVSQPVPGSRNFDL